MKSPTDQFALYKFPCHKITNIAPVKELVVERVDTKEEYEDKKYENVDTWLVVERVDRSGQDVGRLLWPAWEILSPIPPMRRRRKMRISCLEWLVAIARSRCSLL